MTDISLLKIPSAAPPGKASPASSAEEQIKAKKDSAPIELRIKTAPQEPHPDPLNRAAQILEAHFESISGFKKKLTLEKDESAGVVVYRAIDRDTGEVIKQFPPDSLLKLLSYYRSVEGLSFNDVV